MLNKCTNGVCSLQQWFSNFKEHQSPRVLVNYRDLGPAPENLILWVWGEQEPAAGLEAIPRETQVRGSWSEEGPRAQQDWCCAAAGAPLHPALRVLGRGCAAGGALGPQ